jgi:hypothetical protein
MGSDAAAKPRWWYRGLPHIAGFRRCFFDRPVRAEMLVVDVIRRGVPFQGNTAFR